MNRAEQAKAYFEEGYNCCQAVVLAFTDELGIDPKTALAIASSFGGGFGRLREVCGAVSGMCIVAGAKYGYTDPKATTEKADHYQLIRQLAKDFEEKNGSILCKVLTGLDNSSHVPEPRTGEYYQKRPCADLVYDAAELLEKMIYQ